MTENGGAHDEVGFLVERNYDRLCLQYLAVLDIEPDFFFTMDSARALRFGRKEDAERMIEYIYRKELANAFTHGALRAAEHLWIKAMPAPDAV